MDNPLFTGTQPCNDCPYRIDAPLAKWSIEEFEDLIQSDHAYFGTVYGCHKSDKSVCKGWLMDQDRRGFPSISLRIALSQANVTREYLDKLNSPSVLYKSLKQMCIANYPRLISLFKKKSY